MFTGIIEYTGEVLKVSRVGTNKVFLVKSLLTPFLKVDQSLNHNGVCLTVEKISIDHYQVTAIEETLLKTNLNDWIPGSLVNLERCLEMNGRLDGHIVQGHVDSTAICTGKTEKSGSWEYTFETDKQFASLMIEKGSIAINGISLTIYNVTEQTFQVGIIPYTYENTNIKLLQKGDTVNIEFDVFGKYVNRILSLK